MKSNGHARDTLRVAQGQPTALTEGWNLAVFCADRAGGEEAARQVESTLGALGLRVVCHVRQWRFVELEEPSIFEAAVEHALDADLLIVSSSSTGVMAESLWAVLAEWLMRSGADASPLARIVVGGSPDSKAGDEMLTAVRGEAKRAQETLYANLRDAVLVAWDLWQFKHFPCAAGSAGGRCVVDEVGMLTGDGM